MCSEPRSFILAFEREQGGEMGAGEGEGGRRRLLLLLLRGLATGILCVLPLLDSLTRAPGPMDRDESSPLLGAEGSLASSIEPLLLSVTAASVLALLSVLAGSSSPSLAGAAHVACRASLWWVGGAATIHFLAVAMGAPAVALFQQTGLLSLALSALAVVPMVALERRRPLQVFCTPLGEQTWSELEVSFPTTSTIVCAWLGAIPVCLDWNRPWQRWPLTPLLGGLIGHALGCVGIALASYLLCSGRWSSSLAHRSQ